MLAGGISPKDLKEKVIPVYSQDQIPHHIATMAQRAVLYEVTASPKPGLVDRLNAGAHKDMDFYTFMDSSTTLYKGFFDCARLGFSYGLEAARVASHMDLAGMDLYWDESLCLCQLMEAIRIPGIETEKRMFEQTMGINTHKGIIFSLGISCAALGYLEGLNIKTSSLVSSSSSGLLGCETHSMEAICKTVSLMTASLLEKDFEKIHEKSELTYGEKLYRDFGITGIRGEVASGFKTVTENAFPSLRAWQRGELKNHQEVNLSKNDLLLEILLRLMCSCEDSNVLTRGGQEGLMYTKEQAAAFIQEGGMCQADSHSKLEAMDLAFTAKRLSPGGSADLLSVAVFLAMCEGIL